MKYDAFTFDTQVIETNGFNFDGGLLAQLKQFKNGPIKVLVSGVVATEVERHLRAKTLEAKDAVDSAHRKAVLYGLKADGEKAFDQVPDISTLGRNRLLKYLREIGATGVLHDEISARDLMRLYNNGAPPFSTGKKKSEFPDAIALLALEAWAKKNGKRILAASGDKDWQAFAEKSDHIDVVPDLATALAELQQHADDAEAIVQKVLGSIKANSDPALSKSFEQRLTDAVTSEPISAEGDSAYRFEGEVEEIKLNEFELDDDNGVFDAVIVQAGPTTLAFSTSVRVSITAVANFSLFMTDPIDRDEVGLGTNSARRDVEDSEISVLVTLEGNFDKGEFSSQTSRYWKAWEKFILVKSVLTTESLITTTAMAT